MPVGGKITSHELFFRNMVFDKNQDTEPVRLAVMVEYVRKQVWHMDQVDSKALVEEGIISLLPFKPRL